MPFDNYFDGRSPRTSCGSSGCSRTRARGLNKPAAVIVETVQGEGGINVARAEWLRALAELCRAPGHAADRRRHPDGLRPHRRRSSPSRRRASRPDIVTLSKSISGYGLPMALTPVQARAGRLGAGRAQRHLPRQQPRVRHGDGGARPLLGRRRAHQDRPPTKGKRIQRDLRQSVGPVRRGLAPAGAAWSRASSSTTRGTRSRSASSPSTRACSRTTTSK